MVHYPLAYNAVLVVIIDYAYQELTERQKQLTYSP